jgi:beta-lysine N6-acetyltransferase
LNKAAQVEFGKTVKVEKPGYNFEITLSPHNRRIQVLKYGGTDIPGMIEHIEEIIEQHDYVEKVFCKVKKSDAEVFQKNNYRTEGVIRNYFGSEDAVVMAKFPVESREVTEPSVQQKEEEILESLKSQPVIPGVDILPEGYKFKIASDDNDFIQLAELYKQVFESYPFPIFDPEYLKETAKSHIIYGLVYNADVQLVGAASAEMNLEYKNAEMTDFATLLSERGRGLASILLENLEREACKKGVENYYTIARSRSFGMNKVFAKAGYEFTGKLRNNCNISGSFENMSIWCKCPKRDT